MNTSMPGQEGIPSVFSPMARTLPDLVYFTKSIIEMKPWEYDHSVHPLPWRADTYDKTKSQKPLRIGVMRTDGQYIHSIHSVSICLGLGFVLTQRR